MRAAGYGRIINMASGTPFKGVPFLLHYVSSKGAVVAMTKALAKELGGDNILVNTVAPGFTMSDGVLANDVQVEQLQEVSAKARVLVRDQYPEDIVGAVAFFAGDGAAFITGQALVVDGGAYFN
jgi:NAD(P)-dependent dehydrogenase (short-subunit alcohol dehydrogenase family)